MPGDLDLEAQRLARLRQAALMEGDLAPQKAIDAVILVLEVGAHPADQGQVGLPAFDQRTRADATIMDEPLIRLQIGLGPDDACAFNPGLCVDAGDPVDEQQGGRWQAHLTGILVLRFECGAEEVRHLLTRGFLDLGIVPVRSCG